MPPSKETGHIFKLDWDYSCPPKSRVDPLWSDGSAAKDAVSVRSLVRWRRELEEIREAARSVARLDIAAWYEAAIEEVDKEMNRRK